MHVVRRLAIRLTSFGHRPLVALAVLAIVLASASPAWAKKSKAEAEAQPTKSYVVPYMIVIMFVAVGLMTVCRPSRRADKVEDRHEQDDDD